MMDRKSRGESSREQGWAGVQGEEIDRKHQRHKFPTLEIHTHNMMSYLCNGCMLRAHSKCESAVTPIA